LILKVVFGNVRVYTYTQKGDRKKLNSHTSVVLIFIFIYWHSI